MAGLDGCGKLDITNIGNDNLVAIGNKVWIKAEVEEKIWIYQNKPCVVIKFEDACIARMCTDKDPVPKVLLFGVENAQILDCDGGEGDPDEEGSQSLDEGKRKANTIRNEIVSPENKPKLDAATDALDLRSINAQGFQGTAVMPSVAIIPMKSNISTYGPYASSNFGSSCGGTQVEVNTDLCPWVFGSVAGMNGAGQSIVSSMAIGLNKAETGAITIPGLPVSQFTGLGAALGSGGATLSSMNFSYGSGGISTSYEFRTYTPKFGGLNRHLVDRIKDISKNRTEQLKFFRNQQIAIDKTTRKLQRFNARFPAKPEAKNFPNNKPSLQRVLMGEIYNWQNNGQRTVVGTSTLDDSIAEMVYKFEEKAYMSLDGLFGPISKKGDGNLPRYASFDAGCHKASPENPNPPFAIDSGNESASNDLNEYNLEITQQYLDPLTNKFDEDEHHHTGEGRGHVIDLVGKGSDVPQEGLITNFYNLDDENRYSEDYRFLGMRGPLLLHSWGYDTQGKPIPNEADIENETKTGKFKTENLKDKFMSDWLGKPASWPVAPVDFRFDRKRGVWVTPPGYKVVVIELKEKLEPYGTAKAKLINKDTEKNKEFGPKLFDKDGQEVKATEEEDTKAIVNVVDRLGQKYSSGTRAYSYYDTFSCEYIILEAKQKQSIRFRIIDLCESAPVEPDYGDMWTKYAGYGDKFPNNHILGIRINCEGDTIDNKGELINHNDILDDDPEKRKSIFINLFDTCGQFGAAYAAFDVNGGANAFNEWKQKAATGFGLLCDPEAENTCSLGEQGVQCSLIDPQYESYDIIFLDHYSRFVECELTQKLYSESNDYPDDEYKTMDPEGNAAATIFQYYGDPGNGRRPRFYKNNNGGLDEIDFRVFDPFKAADKDRNPFAKLSSGDKVLAVFDENRKKYVIYNSLKDAVSEVVKFALVQDKNFTDLEVQAILVNANNVPITTDQSKVIENQQEFDNNLIYIRDPFTNGQGNIKSRLGPAIGSDKFVEHMEGINLQDNYENELIFPFIGFALKRSEPLSDGTAQVIYEIITLEHYAKFIYGKIASVKAIDGLYLGARLYHTDGVVPIHRGTAALGIPNIQLIYDMLNFNGVHSYIVGDVVEQGGSSTLDSMIDGCRFIATLDPQYSSTNKLVYRIIESEHLALNGKTLIKDYAASNDINSDKDGKGAKQGLDNDKIESLYSNGFMWDKDKSPKKYENIRIRTKCGWVGQAKVTAGSCLETLISGLEDNGSPLYQTISATTIAQVGEKLLTDISQPGLFGHPNFPEDDRKIKTNDYFYEGVNPKLIENEEQRPKFNLTPGQQWMSFEGSKVVGIWDETTGPNISDSKYRILYVEEAPVIITCICNQEFEPFKADNISVEPIFSSSNGSNAAPIFGNLLDKVDNPLGYGAEAGDLVTVQRVFTGVVANGANYKYIVIGTGKPPE